jgi:hypothetical protein
MATSRISASPRPPHGRFLPVLLLWLVLSLGLLVYAFPAIIAFKATDPDDYMRLVEVRDWLAGQSWFDVRQHRMGPPPGADMHWSRLVDCPIAALLWLVRLLAPEPVAIAIAMALVPLLELLAAMLLLHRLLRALDQPPATALTATALPLLFPVLTSNFMPMRIDHHAWQAICALACALALQQHGRRGFVLAGAFAAIWLTISLEGLVLVFALAGLLAWRTLRTGQPALSDFCAAIATVGLLLGTLTETPAALIAPHADQLSWPHLAAFAATAALVAAGARLPAFDQPRVRFAVLALAALGAASILLCGLGPAALDPFHGLDPVVRQLWLDNIPEGLPITRQDWQTRATLAWTPLLVLVGWRLKKWEPDFCLKRGDNKQLERADVSDLAQPAPIRQQASSSRAWDELALFSLAACALSFLLMRGAVAAQLLTVPFSAILLARLFPRAAALPHALLRVPAMLACVLLLTPSLASAVGRLADRHAIAPASGALRPAMATPVATCDLAELARLPNALVLAPLDLGPEILARTGHRVVAGSYHRNSGPMRRVIDAFGGEPAQARAIVRATGAELLAFCPGSAELAIYAARRPDSLARSLAENRPIDWLVRLPGFRRGLEVYRIVD